MGGGGGGGGGGGVSTYIVLLLWSWFKQSVYENYFVLYSNPKLKGQPFHYVIATHLQAKVHSLGVLGAHETWTWMSPGIYDSSDIHPSWEPQAPASTDNCMYCK